MIVLIILREVNRNAICQYYETSGTLSDCNVSVADANGCTTEKIRTELDVLTVERRLWWEAVELSDNRNKRLASAKRPSQQNWDGINNNESVFNNSLCHICGGDHNILFIRLESGGHIITRPFPKQKATKVNVTNGKRRATRLDLIDIFWKSEKVETI